MIARRRRWWAADEPEDVGAVLLFYMAVLDLLTAAGAIGGHDGLVTVLFIGIVVWAVFVDVPMEDSVEDEVGG